MKTALTAPPLQVSSTPQTERIAKFLVTLQQFAEEASNPPRQLFLGNVVSAVRTTPGVVNLRAAITDGTGYEKEEGINLLGRTLTLAWDSGRHVLTVKSPFLRKGKPVEVAFPRDRAKPAEAI